jgi:DNA polymerase-3 subunit beta
MEIVVDKTLLENKISSAVNFIDKRDQSSITSHILLEGRDGKVSVKATDRENGFWSEVEAVVIEPGVATLPGKKFADILRAMGGKEPITIKSDGQQVVISQGESQFTLYSFDPTHFPLFPELEKVEKLEIEPEEFIKGILKVLPSVDTNNPKFELNGALLDIQKEEVRFVGTDTRRLALYRSPGGASTPTKLILHRKALTEIKKIFTDQMKIYYDDTYFILKNGATLFFTKLINGRFPDYERVIPTQFQQKFTLPKSEILRALKQLAVVSNEVVITFLPDKIEMETLSEENLRARTTLPISTPVEKFQLAFNSRYLVDFLNVIEEEEFEIGLQEPELPFVVEAGRLLAVIMPLIV